MTPPTETAPRVTLRTPADKNLEAQPGLLLSLSAIARRADRTIDFVRARVASGELKPVATTPSGGMLFTASQADALRRPAAVTLT